MKKEGERVTRLEVWWRRTSATGVEARVWARGLARAVKRRSLRVDPRKEEEGLVLEWSEEKERGLSLDLGVVELRGRGEGANLVAVKDILVSLQQNAKWNQCDELRRKGSKKVGFIIEEKRSKRNKEVSNRGGGNEGVRLGDNRL